MPNPTPPLNTRSEGNSSLIGNVFLGVLIGAFAMVFIIFQIGLYPPIVKVVSSSHETEGRAAASSKTASEEMHALALSPDKLGQLYEDLVAYHTFIDSVKFWWPVITLLFFTVGSALAVHYVRSTVSEAKDSIREFVRDELKDDFDRKTARAATALEAAEQSYKKATEEIKARLDLAVAAMNQALSLFYWRRGHVQPPDPLMDLGNAISHGARALSKAKGVVVEHLPVEGKIRAEARLLQILVCSDLAYYYALMFKTSQNHEDGKKAREQIVAIRDELETVEPFSHRIALLDSYLYVLSTVSPVTEDDKKRGREAFKNYKQFLKTYFDSLSPGEKCGREFVEMERFFE